MVECLNGGCSFLVTSFLLGLCICAVHYSQIIFFPVSSYKVCKKIMVICNINNKLGEDHLKELCSAAQCTFIVAMHPLPFLKTKNIHRRQKVTEEGRNKHVQLRNGKHGSHRCTS